MRVSLNWLAEYVDIHVAPKELAKLMTMAGLEVEALEPLGQAIREIIAARILAIEPHPRAERLYICHVDTGEKELPVVCGALNLEKGAMVPMALPGTTLPGGVSVEESTIRGELSAGMLLAEDEMGLTDDHTGIMILPRDLQPGTRVSHALSLEDWALEVALTPNRPDCASVIGIAREVAAITGQRLRRPQIEIKEENQFIDQLARVHIDDPKGCPRYAAGMICGVDLKPSPFWLRYRLYVSGIRSINNVVDVTNYVLLEMGQPLHAFDYDRLKENRIVVRRAEAGEVFTTLDGKTHALNGENLMICDGQRSVALAGIMGGLNSEIFVGSTNVLIESAYFDPLTIRRGSKRLAISTEASYRFERGIDVDGVLTALRRALMLMYELGGGKVVRGVIDCYPFPFKSPLIDLRIDRTNRFLGTALAQGAIVQYLKSLEMEVQKVDSNVLRVRPPTFRVDVTREVDLMEEVARLEGYDRIPVSLPAIRPSEEKDSPDLIISERVREIMVGFGFTEIISYSFISPDAIEMLGAEKGTPLWSFVELLNPLTNDQSVMRTSLIPGLLSALKTNRSHGEKDLKLFEWGRVFHRKGKDELPHERPFLSAIMTGLCNRKAWYRDERTVDFYDIKGPVEGLLKSMGFREIQFRKEKTPPPGYHEEVFSAIYVAASQVGGVGQVSPDVMRRYDLEGESGFLFELDMECLLGHLSEVREFKPFVRFPAVFRDLSVVVDGEVESAKISEIIVREGGDLVESVNLYDLFKGGKIGPSEKALAFKVSYRSKDGTLDGKQVNLIHEKIIHRITQETGGRLRER